MALGHEFGQSAASTGLIGFNERRQIFKRPRMNRVTSELAVFSASVQEMCSVGSTRTDQALKHVLGASA